MINCEIDDYAAELYKQLEASSLTEEDRVTVAEAFSEIDESREGKLPEAKLDELFKSCRRELPGYEVRKIISNRKNHKMSIDLVEFTQYYSAQRSNDYSNQFKASIKVNISPLIIPNESLFLSDSLLLSVGSKGCRKQKE